jgi:hypothetical protein
LPRDTPEALPDRLCCGTLAQDTGSQGRFGLLRPGEHHRSRHQITDPDLSTSVMVMIAALVLVGGVAAAVVAHGD